jgi:hypothetical protein
MLRLLALVLLASLPALGQCVSIASAAKHLGKKTCVAGKVLKVRQMENGAYQLMFCTQSDACPFVVRVFPIDFDYVGDVRRLEGKEIEVTGKIREWNHQAEIVLKDSDQLDKDAIKLLPIPKAYDADRRGNTSPGTFSGTKTTKRSHSRAPQEPSQEIDTE